ncbi:hypothetical protein Salat_2536700 [Sesamum alatum]|uniref:Uncharacterized protein n=1 Tax=Sesamum alatum TaxID=300844 RepID=A0AAE1XSF0_9LAMI|nr:hypothetical protein Salat_2536700 [Sesamum alatum]
MDFFSSPTANPTGDGIADTSVGTDEDAACHRKFNYSKFSNLAYRVLGEGDMDALRTPKRFKVRWAERCGFSSVGETSCSARAITEVASSPTRTEGCCVMQFPSVNTTPTLARAPTRVSLKQLPKQPLHETSQDGSAH